MKANIEIARTLTSPPFSGVIVSKSDTAARVALFGYAKIESWPAASFEIVPMAEHHRENLRFACARMHDEKRLTDSQLEWKTAIENAGGFSRDVLGY